MKWIRNLAVSPRPKGDPLVKVAGMPTREDADTCLEVLRRRDIYAEMRQDARGTFELWARQSQEPQARLALGLSGHSVIRLTRQKTVRRG